MNTNTAQSTNATQSGIANCSIAEPIEKEVIIAADNSIQQCSSPENDLPFEIDKNKVIDEVISDMERNLYPEDNGDVDAIYCQRCDAKLDIGDYHSVYINGDNEPYCDDCLNDYCFYCGDCDS